MKPKISVVMPSYNRGQHLKETLHALLNQSLSSHEYEVLLVDNNSTDNTQQTVQDLQQQYPQLRYLKEYDQGVAPTRNKGIHHARADIILFLDDDMIADKRLVEEHLKSHHHHNGSVLGYFETDWKGHESSFLRYLQHSEVQNTFPFEDGDKISYHYFYTGNVSVKKQLIEKIGGFDEKFQYYGVEDIDLGYRLHCYGDSVLFNKKALSFHRYHPQYRVFKYKKSLAGKSLKYFINKFPHLKNSFRFEPYAPFSLAALRLFYSLLYPLTILPTKRLDGIRNGYYHWTIRWAMYRSYTSS